MRAIKAVVFTAGIIKRKNPELKENVILIKAMKDSNVPKFLDYDLELFLNIVNDLFPNIEVPVIEMKLLSNEIINQFKLMS